MIRDVDDVSAVWEVENAVLKVTTPKPRTTREHATSAALVKIKFSFAIPKALYHAGFDGRYYIVLSNLPGQTLGSAGSLMDEDTKKHYVSRVTDAYMEFRKCITTTFHCRLCGMDGSQLSDPWLIKLGSVKDFSHENLVENCRTLGMNEIMVNTW